MEEEIWKDIPKYGGLYEASNFGKIKRLYKYYKAKPFKILKLCKDRYGYLFVHLSKNCKIKSHTVHRLVLETFVGICPLGMQCRHIDGYKLNNRLDNLCWGTPKENSQDRTKHKVSFGNYKLKIFQVIEIKKSELKGTELAKKYKVTPSTISKIRTGKNWGDVNE
jgi:hypothetical protein